MCVQKKPEATFSLLSYFCNKKKRGLHFSLFSNFSNTKSMCSKQAGAGFYFIKLLLRYEKLVKKNRWGEGRGGAVF